MRVGIDISPLALTRAGTARYLQELLPRCTGGSTWCSWPSAGRAASGRR